MFKPDEKLARSMFTIALGMLRSGRSLADIQTFLAQYVAVSTKLSACDAASAVNSVIEVFAANVEKTGVLEAVEQQSSVFVDVSEKTHILPAGARVLTDDEYKAEMEKRSKKEEEQPSHLSVKTEQLSRFER